MTIATCPPSTPTPHGVVVFVPGDFKVSFPEFATVADGALTLNFDLATLQLNNSCRSAVINAATREKLLNLLVAHITQLRNGINGQPAAGIVGRVSDATEGSVSVGTDMGTTVYGQAYYMQTQWGALFWQSTARFRRMQYVPAPVVCADLNPGNGLPCGPFGGC